MPSNPIHSPPTYPFFLRKESQETDWNPNAPPFISCSKYPDGFKYGFPKYWNCEITDWNGLFSIFFAPLILLPPVSWQTYLEFEGVSTNLSPSPPVFNPFGKSACQRRVNLIQLVWSACLDQVQRRHVKLLCYYIHKRSCSAFPVAGSCSDPQAYAAAEICFSPPVAPLGSLASLPEHWSLQVSNE